jgi:monoamine oxidase
MKVPKYSPIAQSIEEWLQVADSANALEDQGRGEKGSGIGEGVVSRRAVIQAAGAGFVATTGLGKLSGLGYAPFPSGQINRIAIVGAGIAGLSAAFHLRRLGYVADVYEAAPRTGGRIQTARGVLGPGLATELGGEFIDSEHHEMIQLAKMFSLPLQDVRGWSERNLRDTYYFSGQARAREEIVQAFRPVAQRLANDRKRLAYRSYKDHNVFAKQVDQMSILEYLNDIGTDGWLLDLLTTAYETENGSPAQVQSALNLVLDSGANPGHPLGAFGDRRYKVKGGNDLLIEALADRLRRQVHLGMRLLAMGQDSAGAYVLTFAKPGGGIRTVKADHVVMTLPFSVLRDVELSVEMPAKKLQAIDKLNYGTHAKMALGMKRRFWRERGLTGWFLSDLPFPSGWDSSQSPSIPYGSLTLQFGGAAGVDLGRGTAQERAYTFTQQMDTLYYGASKMYNRKVTRFNWPSYPLSKGSRANYAVGQYTAFGGVERESVGNLLFAGEHCGAEQGTMNGAAQSGSRAAQLLAKKLRA